MTTRGFAAAAAAAAFFSFAGVHAADAYRAGADWAEIEHHGREIGRAAAHEGERIADEAVDTARRIADEFTDGYEDAKYRYD